MQLRFDLTPGSVDVIKNGTFADAYAFDAGYWNSVTFAVGTGYPGAQPATNQVEMIYMNDTFSYQNISGLAADSVYRRGIHSRYAVTGDQIGIGFGGLWARQLNILESGAQYDLTLRVRKYTDYSGSFGLPAGSGVIELRCGSSGGLIQVNSTGTFTVNATQGGDLHLYVNFYACIGLVDLVKCERSAATTTTVENPIGYEELEEVIEENPEFGLGSVRKFIQEVTFWGDGYDIIQSQLDSYGENSNILCEIYRRCDSNDAWTLYFDGIIFFRDYARDEQQCTIEVTIEENTGYGKLVRNRNVEFTHYDTYSIGANFIGTNQVQQVTLNFPVAASIPNVNAWYCHDLLELSVKFASENELAFSAPDLGGSAQGYGSNGNFSSMFFTTGNELRLATTKPAYTSFLEIWTACRVAFGLYFVIEEIGGVSTFVVKKIDDRYNSGTGSLTIDNVPNIERESFTEVRYKTIDIGFDTILDNWTSAEPLGSLQIRFSSENTRGGNLDLTASVIASNNLIIQKTGEAATTTIFNEYDDRTFFLEMTNHTSLSTKDIYSTPPYNIGVTTPRNNETIFPWNCYGRIRKIIYESGALSAVRGDIINGLSTTAYLLDFKGYEEWIKIDPGTSSDYYFRWKYEFSYPLTESEFSALKANPEYYINFSKTDSGYTKSWFKSLKHSLHTGLTEFVVFSE